MKKNYYLFNPGRMSRKDNTLKFEPAKDEDGSVQKPRYLPVEGVDNLYVFGSIDSNSALYNFLGKNKIHVHFFDFYEHYTGSFAPKEYLLAGKMQLLQSKAHLNNKKRIHIAQSLITGAAHNMMKNVSYYHRRKTPMDDILTSIEELRLKIPDTKEINELMGIEGNIRKNYYSAFEHIVDGFEMNARIKRPPSNELNALISFGNMMCYTAVLDQIYHTQLNSTISFLHEPGTRRYSLALDLAEVFKPVIVDKLIFRLCNKKEIQPNHFERKSNGCFLKDAGRKIFLKAFDERLKETIQHPSLNKKVSYKRIIRMECYKLTKYLLGIDPQFKAFKNRW